MRTLFDKSAQPIWTHEVRPVGVSPCNGRINPTLSARRFFQGAFIASVRGRLQFLLFQAFIAATVAFRQQLFP